MTEQEELERIAKALLPWQPQVDVRRALTRAGMEQHPHRTLEVRMHPDTHFDTMAQAAKGWGGGLLPEFSLCGIPVKPSWEVEPRRLEVVCGAEAVVDDPRSWGAVSGHTRWLELRGSTHPRELPVAVTLSGYHVVGTPIPFVLDLDHQPLRWTYRCTWRWTP